MSFFAPKLCKNKQSTHSSRPSPSVSIFSTASEKISETVQDIRSFVRRVLNADTYWSSSAGNVRYLEYLQTIATATESGIKEMELTKEDLLKQITTLSGMRANEANAREGTASPADITYFHFIYQSESFSGLQVSLINSLSCSRAVKLGRTQPAIKMPSQYRIKGPSPTRSKRVLSK